MRKNPDSVSKYIEECPDSTAKQVCMKSVIKGENEFSTELRLCDKFPHVCFSWRLFDFCFS